MAQADFALDGFLTGGQMGRSKKNQPDPLPHPPKLYKLLGQVAKFYRRRSSNHGCGGNSVL